jgi:hypothetical protein
MNILLFIKTALTTFWIAALLMLTSMAYSNINGYVGTATGTAPTQDMLSMHACDHESGSTTLPCFWDAKHRGNGLGKSFWIDTNNNTHYFGGK